MVYNMYRTRPYILGGGLLWNIVESGGIVGALGNVSTMMGTNRAKYGPLTGSYLCKYRGWGVAVAEYQSVSS